MAVKIPVGVEVCQAYHRTTFYWRPTHKPHVNVIQFCNHISVLFAGYWHNEAR